MTSNYPEFTIIVGTGRSGTSYLTTMLRQAADYGSPAEPKFVAALHKKLPRFGDLNQPENLRQLVNAVHDTPAFHHLNDRRGIPTSADEIYTRVEEPTYTGVLYAAFSVLAEKWGRTRLGYKDPLDLVHMPLLADLIPTARFINIIRDGRDVTLSVMPFNWGANNLYSGMRDWRKHLIIAHRDGQLLPNRYLEIRYEDLLLETETTCRQLGSFLCPPMSAAEIHQLISRINETKRTNNLYGWKRKLDADQQRLCERAAGDILAANGYEIRYTATPSAMPVAAAAYTLDDYIKRGINTFKRRLDR